MCHFFNNNNNAGIVSVGTRRARNIKQLPAITTWKRKDHGPAPKGGRSFSRLDPPTGAGDPDTSHSAHSCAPSDVSGEEISRRDDTFPEYIRKGREKNIQGDRGEADGGFGYIIKH